MSLKTSDLAPLATVADLRTVARSAEPVLAKVALARIVHNDGHTQRLAGPAVSDYSLRVAYDMAEREYEQTRSPWVAVTCDELPAEPLS